MHTMLKSKQSVPSFVEEVKYHEESLKARRKRWMIVKTVCKQLQKRIDFKRLPAETRVSVDEWGMYIRLPYDRKLLVVVRRMLGHDWTPQAIAWATGRARVKYGSADTDGSFRCCYKPKDEELSDVRLYVILDADKVVEGTCHRVLISEEKKEYVERKYMVVCN